jgi:hypothetical protein
MNDRNTYSVLNFDRTGKTQKVLNHKVLLLMKTKVISKAIEVSSCFYGLPKIHKSEIPLSHIMSFVNSLTYGVSSFLAEILFPVVGNSKNTVETSYHYLRNL